MGMVVIQPYILVSKLKKTKTKFLRCTGYLNSIKNPIKQDLLLILVLVQQQRVALPHGATGLSAVCDCGIS